MVAPVYSFDKMVVACGKEYPFDHFAGSQVFPKGLLKMDEKNEREPSPVS